MTKHEELQEKFPFLTGIEFSEEEFVGIVQNKDAQILSFYDIEKCRNDDEKKLLLERIKKINLLSIVMKIAKE